MADDLKPKILKAERVMELLSVQLQRLQDDLPALEEELKKHIQPAAAAANEMFQLTYQAKDMLNTAQRHYKTYEQQKSKLKDLEKFQEQISEEYQELFDQHQKDKKNDKIKKEMELKEKAMQKAQGAVSTLSGDVHGNVRAIETVTESFSDAIVKPMLEAAMHLETWRKVFYDHMNKIAKIEKGAAKEFKSRLAHCQKVLK